MAAVVWVHRKAQNTLDTEYGIAESSIRVWFAYIDWRALWKWNIHFYDADVSLATVCCFKRKLDFRFASLCLNSFFFFLLTNIVLRLKLGQLFWYRNWSDKRKTICNISVLSIRIVKCDFFFASSYGLILLFQNQNPTYEYFYWTLFIYIIYILFPFSYVCSIGSYYKYVFIWWQKTEPEPW